MSQDLLRSGRVHYGDCIIIPGIGVRVVNDSMSSRIKNGVDILVFTHAEEKKIGVRHLKVYVLEGMQNELLETPGSKDNAE